jgi:CBS domain-containing protein
MDVKDFMTTPVQTCKQTQTVCDAAKLMTDKGFSVIPVVNDQDELVGLVTESDFIGKDVEIPHALVSLKRTLGENHYYGDIERIYARAKDRTLDEVMSTKLTTVTPSCSLNKAVNMMGARNLKRIPVVENGKIVGIITRKDIVKAFQKIESSK